jgi:class 3 adenylate cyclase
MTQTAGRATQMLDRMLSSNDSSAVERRLATILIADVYEYSRLVEEHEERTVRTLRGHRAIFDKWLQAHKGRVFNAAGDTVLAEFPGAVDAVRCAIDIQAAMRTRNEQLPSDQRMWLRIGINLGDVIVQGGDLLGDGVNVAARIQSIAEPGGVCISGSVYDQIQTRLTLPIRPLGERTFKNIALPIRTFAISVDEGAPRPLDLRWRRARKGPFAVAAAVAVLLVVVAAGFWMHRDYDVRGEDDELRAATSKRAGDLRRLVETEQAAAVSAQREAALLAELKSARDALEHTQTTKLEAGHERVGSAETSQRQAKIQEELKSDREVVQKGQEREKTVTPLKAAGAAAQGATASMEKAMAAPAPADSGIAPQPVTQAATDASLVPAGAAADAKAADRFDGVYPGQMCTPHVDNTLRCWDVNLKVQQGTLSATWPSPFSTKLARASGTISPEGAVDMTLSGYWARNGEPIAGKMSGRWAVGTISAAGAWSTGSAVSATWKAAPGTPPVPVDGLQASADDEPPAGDAPGRQKGRGRHRHQ